MGLSISGLKARVLQPHGSLRSRLLSFSSNTGVWWLQGQNYFLSPETFAKGSKTAGSFIIVFQIVGIYIFLAKSRSAAPSYAPELKNVNDSFPQHT